MKLLRIKVFLGVLALVSHVHAGEIEKICQGIKGINTCKATFDFPTGAKAKMCPNKFPEYVPCKTRTTYKYPCPTWRKPGRLCDGWTCVPGTKEVWKDIPCGITIITERVDLCKSVRSAMGNVGQQFIEKTAGMCTCLPEAFRLISSGIFDAVKNGNGFSGAVGSLVKDLIKVQKCLIDNGFGIKDNKNAVMADQLANKDGYTVLKAAEIDLVMYGELATALATCATTCNVDYITNVFTRYLTESKNLMADQITAFLTGWLNIFEAMKQNLLNIGDATKDLVADLDTIPGRIKKIEERICQKNACLGPAISKFMKNVSEALATSKAIKDVSTAVVDIQRDVPKMSNKVEATIKAAKSLPDMTNIVDLVKNIQKIEDILKAMNVAKDLPKLAKEIKQDGNTVLTFITKYGGRGDNALKLAQEIISTSWESYPLEFTTDSSGNVRAGLVEIQKIIRDEITSPLRNVTDAFKALDNKIDNLPIKRGNLVLNMGVASYQRYSEISMKVPCTRTATKKFTVVGNFKGSFDYPEFYACPYGPKKIPWPNHHIPFIKFKVS